MTLADSQHRLMYSNWQKGSHFGFPSLLRISYVHRHSLGGFSVVGFGRSIRSIEYLSFWTESQYMPDVG